MGRTPRSAAGPLAGLDSSNERRVRADPRGPGGPPHKYFAWLLFSALCFATVTGFVHAAWAVQSFEAGILALFAVVVLRCGLGRWRTLLPFGIPIIGLAQLAFGRTVSQYETRLAVLHWAALAAVFSLAGNIGKDRRANHAFLKAFLCFSVALAVLCALQLFTSQGRVLWLFDTGYRNVYGTFPSPNNYAQFVQLALPVALWFTLCSPGNALRYALASGVLYASVIGSASRTGALLCSIELIAFALIGVLRSRAATVLALVPAAAAVFTAVMGWERIWMRFHQPDPYLFRREYFEAALSMARQHPATGFGLGTFPLVADAFAVKDFPYSANHVHNDWLEFAADGGAFFAFFLLAFLGFRIPAMFRHAWALGLLAVMLHACVDYPFPRCAVSGWIFALLGLLDAERNESSSAPLSAG